MNILLVNIQVIFCLPMETSNTSTIRTVRVLHKIHKTTTENYNDDLMEILDARIITAPMKCKPGERLDNWRERKYIHSMSRQEKI
uniref:CSON004925 protein n=1 Tax=Culicoides sonorensis TaxID=179676 RepID=A0A336MTI2_CULSO